MGAGTFRRSESKIETAERRESSAQIFPVLLRAVARLFVVNLLELIL